MGVKEANKLMPFIRQGSKKKIEQFMRMTRSIEIIPEVYMSETKESRAWKAELADWKAKVIEIDPEYPLKGNESIKELEEICLSLKKLYSKTFPDDQVPSW